MWQAPAKWLECTHLLLHHFSMSLKMQLSNFIQSKIQPCSLQLCILWIHKCAAGAFTSLFCLQLCIACCWSIYPTSGGSGWGWAEAARGDAWCWGELGACGGCCCCSCCSWAWGRLFSWERSTAWVLLRRCGRVLWAVSRRPTFTLSQAGDSRPWRI